MAEHNTREGWFPPPRDCLKINIDAAFCSSSREASLGAVARNTEAEVCFSAVTKLQGFESPLQAEIKAIWFGLQVAREMNYKSIQLESDCLLTVLEISKKDDSYYEWDCFISEILDLSLEYESCDFFHISRKANNLAHNIAKSECILGEHRIWRNELPPLICNLDSRSA